VAFSPGKEWAVGNGARGQGAGLDAQVFLARACERDDRSAHGTPVFGVISGTVRRWTEATRSEANADGGGDVLMFAAVEFSKYI
jgi:hypothetical protein